ncbi:hypothetical protein Scep_004520 [Stephania cephalantha]|uniref:Aminotransferase-like plant mobile domain-containing protein n=1 Tax=Stephania cephalantha TaxID=152367 RepID=A0AAP0PZ66_9MAGN
MKKSNYKTRLLLYLPCPLLKCTNHGAQIEEWDLQSCHPNTEGFQRIIQRSGLTLLINCSYQKGNKELISTFVKWWQPKTNTFHMPLGDISITYEDVNILLKISVICKVVAMESFSRYTEDSRKEALN